MKILRVSFILCFLPMLALAETVSHGYSPFYQLKYNESFEHFDYVQPLAPKGGKFKLHTRINFNSFNPFIIKGTADTSIHKTFDTLLAPALDEVKSHYGLVAEKITIADDKSYVIFDLRKEAKFHDGKHITAKDLAFTFQILKEHGTPNYKVNLSEVQDAVALNSHQIRYNFKNPSNLLLVSMIGELPILSKEFFADKDFATYSSQPILGSGPYKVKSFKFGKYVEYERVQNYWGRNLPVNKGMYNFDTLEYQVYLDTTIAVEAFKAGEYDYKEENFSKNWAMEYTGPNFTTGKIKKVLQPHKNPAGLMFFTLNTRRSDLKDINLRRAIEYAYDFDWLNKYMNSSIFQRQESYFENSEFKATAIPSGKELDILNKYRDIIPAEVFEKQYRAPSTKADPLEIRANLTHAKELLLSSGYTIKGDKMISPYTHKPVVIEAITYQANYEKLFNKIARNLAMIGITLKIKIMDYAQYQKRLSDFNFDLATVSFAPALIPKDNQRLFWHSASGKKSGGLNYSGIDDPAVDGIIEGLSRAKSIDDIKAHTKALDRVLSWNHYNVLQLYSSNYRILYWDKFGIPEIKPDYDIGLHTWWSKNY